jgi:hypothetical protein
MAKRFYCTQHGFVVPTAEVIPMCPYCDHPVSEVRTATA